MSGTGNEDAIVVFGDDTDLCGLRLLRRGFRHCSVVLRRGEVWVVVDPLAHRTDLEVVSDLVFSAEGAAPSCNAIADALTRQGRFCLIVQTRHPPKRLAPLRFYSCVEEVKRLLGLHAPLVFTPWQLYRRLSSENNPK